jgi:hypothetical protein
MDTSRLVSKDDGDTLWTYKHISASKHIQRINDVQCEHTSIQEPTLQLSFQLSPPKLCDIEKEKEKEKDISKNLVLVINIHEQATHQHNDNYSNSQQTRQTCRKDMDLFNFMMLRIDDLSSIYTYNMVRDAIQTLKDRLVLLLTDGPVPDKFGPKKSRTLLSWVTNNKRGTPASDESATTVAEFVSWFLDISVGIIPKKTDTTDAIDAVDSDSTKARSKSKPKSKSKSKIETALDVCIATKTPSSPSPFALYRKKGAWWITWIE